MIQGYLSIKWQRAGSILSRLLPILGAHPISVMIVNLGQCQAASKSFLATFFPVVGGGNGFPSFFRISIHSSTI